MHIVDYYGNPENSQNFNQPDYNNIRIHKKPPTQHTLTGSSRRRVLPFSQLISSILSCENGINTSHIPSIFFTMDKEEEIGFWINTNIENNNIKTI